MIAFELPKLGEQVAENEASITRTQEEFLGFLSLHAISWSRGTEEGRGGRGWFKRKRTCHYPAGPQNRKCGVTATGLGVRGGSSYVTNLSIT